MITSRDRRHFHAAAKLAEFSTFKNKKYPVGCVVVYKNRVISTGFNKDRTDPLQGQYNVERNIPEYSPHKVHAEVDAIKHVLNLDIDWRLASIYIYRKCKSREHGLARPCKSCMALIRDVGIRNIYYTTDDGYAYEELKEV